MRPPACARRRAPVLTPRGGLSTAAPSAGRRLQCTPPGSPAAADPSLVDLTHARVVPPATLSLQERTAVRVLIEEIEKRTNIRLSVSTQWPSESTPAIAVGPLAGSPTWAGPGLRGAPSSNGTPGREGYRL